jgi:cobalamin biosynthesis Mg chelatase CobN
MMNNSTGRGQTTAKKAVALVIGLVVVALLASYLMPIALDALNSDTSVTTNQTTSTETEINAELNSTVTATTAGTDATIELTSDNTTTSKTIAVGSNSTYSFDRGDVTVSVSEAQTGYAVATYDYPKDFSYSSGAQAMWGILGLIVILAVFLFVLGIALDGMNRL